MNTMTDKELLELAAKAAGYDETKICIDEWFWVLTDKDDWHPWNPLTNDGDALQLAVKFLFEIDMGRGCIAIRHSTGIKIMEAFNGDPYAATRRAIVRVAAEIGKSMGEQE